MDVSSVNIRKLAFCQFRPKQSVIRKRKLHVKRDLFCIAETKTQMNYVIREHLQKAKFIFLKMRKFRVSFPTRCAKTIVSLCCRIPSIPSTKEFCTHEMYGTTFDPYYISQIRMYLDIF
jgi:hypothetical protein